MKHAYIVGCECARCAKEAIRRNTQSRQTSGNHYTEVRARFTRIRATRRRPVVGSQEWAETRADDIDYSGDY